MNTTALRELKTVVEGRTRYEGKPTDLLDRLYQELHLDRWQPDLNQPPQACLQTALQPFFLEVCNMTGIRMDQLFSQSRPREPVAHVRFAVWRVLQEEMCMDQHEIGVLFNRDQTNIGYGINKAIDLCSLGLCSTMEKVRRAWEVTR